MAIYEWNVPEDSAAWPCPEACGFMTDDPYGGPCTNCWRALDDEESSQGW